MTICHDPDFNEDAHLPRPGGELLWAIRTWVIGVCRSTPVEGDIRDVLAAIAAPGAADMLFAFMWTVGLRTTRKLRVSCVCNPQVEPDERALLDVVALYQHGRNLEAMALLRSILPPDAALAAREPATRLALMLAESGHRLPPSSAPAARQAAILADGAGSATIH